MDCYGKRVPTQKLPKWAEAALTDPKWPLSREHLHGIFARLRKLNVVVIENTEKDLGCVCVLACCDIGSNPCVDPNPVEDDGDLGAKIKCRKCKDRKDPLPPCDVDFSGMSRYVSAAFRSFLMNTDRVMTSNKVMQCTCPTVLAKPWLATDENGKYDLNRPVCANCCERCDCCNEPCAVFFEDADGDETMCVYCAGNENDKAREEEEERVESDGMDVSVY